MNHKHYWLAQQVRQSRDDIMLQALPVAYTRSEVLRLRQMAIVHLKQLEKDSTGTLAQRIALSKADSFEEIVKILDSELDDFE